MSEQILRDKINSQSISNGIVTAGVIASVILSPMSYGSNSSSNFDRLKTTKSNEQEPGISEKKADEIMVDNIYGSLKQNADYIEISTELKNFKNNTVETIGKMETASNSQYQTLVDSLKSIETKIDLLPSKEYVDGKISESEARTIKWVIATGISVIVLAFGVFTWYSNSTTSLINIILNEIPKLKK